MPSKQDIKSMGDAIGQPDDVDKKFLKELIDEYDRRYPGQIAFGIKKAQEDQFNSSTAFKDMTKGGQVDELAHRQHIFELPAMLVGTIEKHYPTMFREPSHFAWFKKNFKELMIPKN